MLDAVDDGVSRALAAVPREHYTDAGCPVPVPPAAAVHRDLSRAGIGPGMRVLEVGTGTGYTSAVLAELVGDGGLVVSVDIAAALVERAAALHAGRGVRGVLLRAGDGHLGVPDLGPYDAVVAWASPLEIPAAWVRQSRPGAVVCSPVYLAPVAGAIGHLRAVVGADGQLLEPDLAAASSIDMATRSQITADQPDHASRSDHVGQFDHVGQSDDAGEPDHAGPVGRPAPVGWTMNLPIHHVDARENLPGGTVAWISTAWRGAYPGHRPESALRMLCEPEFTERVDLPGAGDTDRAGGVGGVGGADGTGSRAAAWRDFRAYCTARDPSNLTSFGITGEHPVTAVGFSSGLNAAVLTSDGVLVANGADSPALTKVRDYLAEWERSGRPGVETLRPVLRATADGWQVRTTPSRLARRRVGGPTASPAGATPFARPNRSGPVGRAPGGDKFL